MKKTVTSFLVLLSVLSLSQVATAQLRLPGITNGDVRQALEKVIADYPRGFSTLKGEVLNNNPQTVEYASMLQFKTAEKNTITEYSGKQPIFSWQALMLTEEEFAVAEKKYKSLYKDLKGMTLTLNRDYSYGLDGKFGEADESKKFATSTFYLTPNAANLPKVRVELSMQYEMTEWKIYLTVYQKEREDSERGKTVD